MAASYASICTSSEVLTSTVIRKQHRLIKERQELDFKRTAYVYRMHSYVFQNICVVCFTRVLVDSLRNRAVNRSRSWITVKRLTSVLSCCGTTALSTSKPRSTASLAGQSRPRLLRRLHRLTASFVGQPIQQERGARPPPGAYLCLACAITRRRRQVSRHRAPQYTICRSTPRTYPAALSPFPFLTLRYLHARLTRL